MHSVKLINFKSIGDYPESEVVLEPRVTAIIGKNESGKSNVLDVVQRSEITRFCTETGTSTTLGKPLTAKLLCTAIENGSFELNKQSIDNFQKLFDRIARYTA